MAQIKWSTPHRLHTKNTLRTFEYIAKAACDTRYMAKNKNIKGIWPKNIELSHIEFAIYWHLGDAILLDRHKSKICLSNGDMSEKSVTNVTVPPYITRWRTELKMKTIWEAIMYAELQSAMRKHYNA